MATKKKTDEAEDSVKAEASVEAAVETESGAVVEAEPVNEAPKKARTKAAKAEQTETADGVDDAKVSRGKRAEKIGVVASDKMTKTVVVRVDRLVKHPIYRKYVRKRKKFMAHDEMGSKIGDKVRIVETRPMSARKRWRVVEIIQKAEL